MPGRQTFRADLAGHPQQRLELYVSVAIGAGDWRTSGKVLLDERTDDAILKLLLKVDDVVRKIEVLRDAFRIVHIVKRAATVLRRSVSLQFRQPALVP